MCKSDFFEFRRFSLYFHKLFVERLRMNLMRFFLLLGLLFIVIFWMGSTTYVKYLDGDSWQTTDPIWSVEAAFAAFLFFVGGCYSASLMWIDLGRKPERIFVLTTPVTTFESWLTRWLLYVPGYMIVFLLSFYAVDALRVCVFSAISPVSCHIGLLPLCGNGGFMNMEIIRAYLVFTSFFVLGGSFFPRRPLLSTAIALFVIGLLGGCSTASFIVFAADMDFSSKIMNAYLWLLPLLCWALSYWRYWEMEIIDRL
ncbi:MAG: hypothetical protein IJ196_08090 [Prevotella sp.]|nr:hypothetical protein [Prevotella sp.]